MSNWSFIPTNYCI